MVSVATSPPSQDPRIAESRLRDSPERGFRGHGEVGETPVETQEVPGGAQAEKSAAPHVVTRRTSAKRGANIDRRPLCPPFSVSLCGGLPAIYFLTCVPVWLRWWPTFRRIVQRVHRRWPSFDLFFSAGVASDMCFDPFLLA